MLHKGGPVLARTLLCVRVSFLGTYISVALSIILPMWNFPLSPGRPTRRRDAWYRARYRRYIAVLSLSSPHPLHSSTRATLRSVEIGCRSTLFANRPLNSLDDYVYRMVRLFEGRRKWERRSFLINFITGSRCVRMMLITIYR